MTNNKSSIQYLIVDWGTTNFRVFAINSDNEILKQQALPMGLLQVENGDFAKALEGVLADLLSNYKHLPIFMAGMVGSQAGWHNVPYAQTPVSSKQLTDQAFTFELPWGAKATIIPGVSHQSEENTYDVMRGEEVQLVGLAKLIDQRSFNAILPGTHSKHVSFENDQITSFETYMTGELFSVISNHTILGKGLVTQESNEQVFLEGVQAGQTEQITHVLFSARTKRLFNQLNDKHVHEFISGMLIGYELKNTNVEHLYLIGGSSLCLRYTKACEKLAIKTTTINGDECFITGMQTLVNLNELT